jgi:hypothetical protein
MWGAIRQPLARPCRSCFRIAVFREALRRGAGGICEPGDALAPHGCGRSVLAHGAWNGHLFAAPCLRRGSIPDRFEADAAQPPAKAAWCRSARSQNSKHGPGQHQRRHGACLRCADCSAAGRFALDHGTAEPEYDAHGSDHADTVPTCVRVASVGVCKLNVCLLRLTLTSVNGLLDEGWVPRQLPWLSSAPGCEAPSLPSTVPR